MPYLELSPDLKLFYKIDDWTDPWTRPATVLLVHGFPENTEAWRAWVPYLARHYRVIRIDVRGFGQNSPVSEDFVFTTELFVDDLVRVINHLAGEPVHVAGIKSGGIMVVKLAAMRPDLVKTITVMAPPVVAVPAEGWVEHIKQHGMRSWARFSNPPRFGSKMPLRALDWWVDMYGSTAVSTVLPYLRWASANDIRADLEHVKCPTSPSARSIDPSCTLQTRSLNAEAVMKSARSCRSTACRSAPASRGRLREPFKKNI